MRISETALKEVILIEPEVHEDRRGCFLELYQLDRYAKAGLPSRFVQDNLAHSSRGVLRGLHYQVRHPQGKLVTVLRGRVFDVAVDIRRGSPSFGKWSAVELSGDNQQQLYVPPGFAHGYCVLSETAAVLYKCTDFYFPEDERGIVWNDPAVGIPWPIQEPLLSEKDRGYRTLAESEAELPLYAARLTERLN